jgi:transcriptional regulator with XRE-family HTH domain
MQITRISMFTNKVHKMDIDVTQEQLSSWENGTLIQDAMPNLSADEREFIKTGVTPSEWAEFFGEEDEEEDDGCIGEYTHPAQYVDDNDSYLPDEDDGQPSWEQEWEDFGEVYSDEY